MKIALDISPLQNGHKFRGTGFYVLHLKEALETYFPQHTYIFFTKQKEIPSDVDVIHYPYFDPFSLTIPKKNLDKTILTILDLTPIIFPKAFPAGIKGNLRWLLQKYMVKKIRGVITDSISAQKDIYNYIHVSSDRIAVTYLAAGEEFTQVKSGKLKVKSVLEKYNLPEKFALYVGDITWNKNVPRIVAAAQQAQVPLVMVGRALVQQDFDRDNIWNADLVTLQHMTQGDTKIFSLGFVSSEDLVALYNCATVFVMPSLYEGFGLPILEAMSCGCPVITSKEGSLAEVAGDAGYIVDAYDSSSIAEGIRAIFSDTKLQEHLRKKGMAQAQKFSWKQTAKETLRAYEKFLAKK